MFLSPFISKPDTVAHIMLKVLLALLPGIALYVWYFGAAILVSITLASVTALATEAVMLKLRNRPVLIFLKDDSALLTAWLLALSIPPLAPWWLVVVGTAFAIAVAKHLYGGLGNNIFNPAMVGYAVLIVFFPAQMTHWVAPLGVENIAWGFLFGGIFLLASRIIRWHIPVAYLVTLFIIAGIFHLAEPGHYAAPLFHLFSGATMLGAFFILTDPVTSPTTHTGRLIFAAGAALLTYVIRVFGSFPDDVAFATLLMNMCVPLIVIYTQPKTLGKKMRLEMKLHEPR